ncbi:hypothetical protein HanIR_Chr02g0063551 [Helianthus annuus]|nr:hypothetical protein HanIR_Chr02g0063551 [Helianthus annuus]KAJ0618129.1 hypothetical protein HanHA89_Chr02g0049691 [Helianthus annuus]
MVFTMLTTQLTCQFSLTFVNTYSNCKLGLMMFYNSGNYTWSYSGFRKHSPKFTFPLSMYHQSCQNLHTTS